MVPKLPSAPATRLEAFKPNAGSVVTFGYDDLGAIREIISVDGREIRDANGASVRGLLVPVNKSEDSKERTFIDQRRFRNCYRDLTRSWRFRPIRRNSRASRFGIRRAGGWS